MQTQELASDIEHVDEEDLEPSRPGCLRRAFPLVAVLVLAAFLLWTAGPLLPRHSADAEGRPLNVAGDPIPRLPDRILRDGSWLVTYEFWFRDAIRKVVVRVPQQDYATSESRPEGMRVDPSESRETWTRRYYTRQLEWPEQQRAVETALSQLRPIRTALHLSSDDYVRMLNAFVGTIPYPETSETDGASKTCPCSVLVEGVGDCDEKSMLLGSLLAAEGYDSALLLLEKDNHMAVGVRSGTRSYKGTLYAFIDAVGVSVREPNHEYQQPVDVGRASKTYKSTPLVVRLTSGGTRFGSE